MSIEVIAKCDQCRAKLEADDVAEITCDACWTEAQKKILELEAQVAGLVIERDEAEEKLALESEVYASQIREKDKLIGELLARVHAA